MNLLTHADWYTEYYTNQEYGLLFWRDERFNLQNLSLSSRNKAFYRFAYSNRLELRMAYSNRQARMHGGLPNHICRSCDQRLATWSTTRGYTMITMLLSDFPNLQSRRNGNTSWQMELPNVVGSHKKTSLPSYMWRTAWVSPASARFPPSQL